MEAEGKDSAAETSIDGQGKAEKIVDEISMPTGVGAVQDRFADEMKTARISGGCGYSERVAKDRCRQPKISGTLKD